MRSYSARRDSHRRRKESVQLGSVISLEGRGVQHPPLWGSNAMFFRKRGRTGRCDDLMWKGGHGEI